MYIYYMYVHVCTHVLCTFNYIHVCKYVCIVCMYVCTCTCVCTMAGTMFAKQLSKLQQKRTNIQSLLMFLSMLLLLPWLSVECIQN